MAGVQTGTTLDIGAGTITGSYLVQTRGEGDKDIDSEDHFDQDGKRVNRTVYNADDKIELDLLCLLDADPETDFVKGSIAAHVDFSDHWVEDAKLTKSKAGRRAVVSLTDIGIT